MLLKMTTVTCKRQKLPASLARQDVLLDALRVLCLDETLCPISLKDEWVGCVWARLRKKDREQNCWHSSGIESSGVCQQKAYSSLCNFYMDWSSFNWILWHFCRHQCRNTQSCHWGEAATFCSYFVMGRFLNDERSILMHMHCGWFKLSSWYLCWSVINSWAEEKGAKGTAQILNKGVSLPKGVLQSGRNRAGR